MTETKEAVQTLFKETLSAIRNSVAKNDEPITFIANWALIVELMLHRHIEDQNTRINVNGIWSISIYEFFRDLSGSSCRITLHNGDIRLDCDFVAPETITWDKL